MVAGDGAQSKSWTARDIILAAAGGCLAAISTVIIVFVILSPGHIIFFVTHASYNSTISGVNLKFTIYANNTSHHAKVKFLSFFVIVKNSTVFMDAHVEHMFQFPAFGYMSGSRFMNITASVYLPEPDMVSTFPGHRLTVVLISQVRFLIGVARTKMFDIRVSCPHVTFVEDTPKSLAQEAFPCYG